METLKSKKEFSEVFNRGQRVNSPLVRICVLRCNDGQEPKVAFVAAKRLGNAVWRNRSKRVLREAARLVELPAQGSRVILFATRETHDAHPAEVAAALRRMRRKASF